MPGNLLPLPARFSCSGDPSGSASVIFGYFRYSFAFSKRAITPPNSPTWTISLAGCVKSGTSPAPTSAARRSIQYHCFSVSSALRVVLDDQRGREALVPGGKRGNALPQRLQAFKLRVHRALLGRFAIDCNQAASRPRFLATVFVIESSTRSPFTSQPRSVVLPKDTGLPSAIHAST